MHKSAGDLHSSLPSTTYPNDKKLEEVERCAKQNGRHDLGALLLDGHRACSKVKGDSHHHESTKSGRISQRESARKTADFSRFDHHKEDSPLAKSERERNAVRATPSFDFSHRFEHCEEDLLVYGDSKDVFGTPRATPGHSGFEEDDSRTQKEASIIARRESQDFWECKSRTEKGIFADLEQVELDLHRTYARESEVQNKVSRNMR